MSFIASIPMKNSIVRSPSVRFETHRVGVLSCDTPISDCVIWKSYPSFRHWHLAAPRAGCCTVDGPVPRVLSMDVIRMGWLLFSYPYDIFMLYQVRIELSTVIFDIFKIYHISCSIYPHPRLPSRNLRTISLPFLSSGRAKDVWYSSSFSPVTIFHPSVLRA